MQKSQLPDHSGIALRRVLSLVAFGFATFASITAPARAFHGKITNPEGEPLEGIRVVAVARGTQPPFLDPIATGRTAPDGMFDLGSAPLTASHSLILELHGEQGTGRLRIEGAETKLPLNLVYPVQTTVIFLHDNDNHWNFNFIDAFREKVEFYRERYKNVFLLNAGDNFIRHRHRWPQDDLTYYARMSAMMIQTMNEMGYDAATLGNHELHYHEGATRRALDQARFPLLVANVEIETDRLPDNILPRLLLETEEGYRIGVIGLSEVPVMEGLKRLEIYSTARTHIDQLASAADVLIALTHIGFTKDQRLARRFPELDVIIGGHTHSLVENEFVNGVLIAQAGGVPGRLPVDSQLPKFLGRVKLVLENGRVVNRDATVYRFAPSEARDGQRSPPASFAK